MIYDDKHERHLNNGVAWFQCLAIPLAVIATTWLLGCSSVESVRHVTNDARGIEYNLEGLSVIDPSLSDVTFNTSGDWVQVDSKLSGVYLLCFPFITGKPGGGVAWFTDTVTAKSVTEMALAACDKQGFSDMRSLSLQKNSDKIEIIDSVSGVAIPHLFRFKTLELLVIATPKQESRK